MEMLSLVMVITSYNLLKLPPTVTYSPPPKKLMAFVLKKLTNPANRRCPRQEVYVFKDVLADSLAGPGSSPEHPLNHVEPQRAVC